MSMLESHTRRGDALLLSHCAAFCERPQAYSRLEDQVGPRMARLLVFALTGRQERRGSSSP
jgi:hypothetical protein